MRDHPLNPILVDRAVELWKRALAAPVYNNLAPGEDHMPSMLTNMMLTVAPKDNTPEKLKAFGEALKARIESPTTSHDGTFTYYEDYMGVDYHPSRLLKDAAEDVGLNMPFPIKTGLNIDDDCVSFHMGYASSTMYHYPLADGRWLVTDLTGRADMLKIIACINAGHDLGLTIEPA